MKYKSVGKQQKKNDDDKRLSATMRISAIVFIKLCVPKKCGYAYVMNE